MAVSLDHARESRLPLGERIDRGLDALAGPDHQTMLAA
jgi:hypothetical protein